MANPGTKVQVGINEHIDNIHASIMMPKTRHMRQAVFYEIAENNSNQSTVNNNDNVFVRKLQQFDNGRNSSANTVSRTFTSGSSSFVIMIAPCRQKLRHMRSSLSLPFAPRYLTKLTRNHPRGIQMVLCNLIGRFFCPLIKTFKLEFPIMKAFLPSNAKIRHNQRENPIVVSP